MLLFLPSGVMSITAHSEGSFKLVVRSLHREMIQKYFPNDVYYDSTEELPYHTTILRAQLQELMFVVLESIEYTNLKKAAPDGRYGKLVEMVHRSMSVYPDYESVSNPSQPEPEPEVPESSQILAAMVLGGMMPKNTQIRL